MSNEEDTTESVLMGNLETSRKVVLRARDVLMICDWLEEGLVKRDKLDVGVLYRCADILDAVDECPPLIEARVCSSLCRVAVAFESDPEMLIRALKRSDALLETQCKFPDELEYDLVGAVEEAVGSLEESKGGTESLDEGDYASMVRRIKLQLKLRELKRNTLSMRSKLAPFAASYLLGALMLLPVLAHFQLPALQLALACAVCVPATLFVPTARSRNACRNGFLAAVMATAVASLLAINVADPVVLAKAAFFIVLLGIGIGSAVNRSLRCRVLLTEYADACLFGISGGLIVLMAILLIVF